MSMMPGSSRDRILELERSNAVLKGALEAATEQNERLQEAAVQLTMRADEYKAEAERLRAELDKLRDEREEARWDAMGEDL